MFSIHITLNQGYLISIQFEKYGMNVMVIRWSNITYLKHYKARSLTGHSVRCKNAQTFTHCLETSFDSFVVYLYFPDSFFHVVNTQNQEQSNL